MLQAAFAGGIMKGISNDMKLSMSDMYYLGGPLTLRGFQMRGVGPQSESNALGSTVSFCTQIISKCFYIVQI